MTDRTGTDNIKTRGGTFAFRFPDLHSVFYLAAIFTALLVLVPVLYLAVRAAGSEGAFTDLISRPRTWEILKRSVLLSFSVTFLSALISVPLAWILERTNLPLKRVWTVLTTVPVVIPSYVAGFVTVSALGPRGLIQQLLEPLGVERLPEIYGFWGALLTLTLVRYPYVLLPVRAALSKMDPSLEESSRSLGKTPFQTFTKVILPQMRPALAAGCLLTALTALADFGAVSLLRYETFTWAIYIQYQSLFDRSAAASLSLVLVAFALSLLMLEWLTEKKAPLYSTSRGNRPPLEPIRLGKWKAPALSLLAVISLGSILIPVSILGMWLVRGIVSGELMPGLTEPLFNSVYISAMGALATLLLAFPVAWLAVMKRSRLTSILERISYLGFALPGTVYSWLRASPSVRSKIRPLISAHISRKTITKGSRPRLCRLRALFSRIRTGKSLWAGTSANPDTTAWTRRHFSQGIASSTPSTKYSPSVRTCVTAPSTWTFTTPCGEKVSSPTSGR